MRAVSDDIYQVFYLSFIFCYCWGFMNTTMFKNDFSDAFKLQMEGYLHLAVICALICGIISVLLQDSVSQAVFEVLLIVVGFCHWKLGAGKYEFFVLCVLIVGMTGRSFKVLTAIALIAGSIMMAVTFAASQTGVITDLVYEGGRHSFGIIYCTDCAAHFLFLMIMYTFLRLDSLHIVEYIALALLFVLMTMTKAQSDIMCGALLLAGIVLYRLTRRWHNTIVMRVLALIGSFSFLICAGGAFLAALKFDRSNRKLHATMPYLGQVLLYRLFLYPSFCDRRSAALCDDPASHDLYPAQMLCLQAVRIFVPAGPCCPGVYAGTSFNGILLQCVSFDGFFRKETFQGRSDPCPCGTGSKSDRDVKGRYRVIYDQTQ